MPIKPGDMGSESPDNVTPADFANSMAADMEAELNRLLLLDGLDQLDTTDNSAETRHRRRLFVAIARGVVKHLEQHRSSITVTVSIGGNSGSGSPTFDVEGRDWTP